MDCETLVCFDQIDLYPRNGTRSEGIIISDNMSEIVMQVACGPRIAASCKKDPAYLF